MERIIEMTPAFDRRNSDPSKNYGIHGVELRMVLKGELGAVQFVTYTNWHLPHVQEELLSKPILDKMDVEVRFAPMAADVGYHSPKPMYEGQEPMNGGNCPYVEGGKCYYDGSGLAAVDMFQVLVREGSEGVWRELEQRYAEIFENENMTADTTDNAVENSTGFINEQSEATGTLESKTARLGNEEHSAQ